MRVLVVDDEPNIRATLALCLEERGCAVQGAASAEAALARVRAQPFDVAFLDLRLGADDGLALLPELLRERPSLAVIVITAYATFETAVRAIQLGAANYLPKPFTPDQIRVALDQAVRLAAMSQRVAHLESALREAVPEIELESRAPAMKAALDLISRAARSDVPVLLRGESGSGKGVAARMLHTQSARRDRALIVVNCPTLSEDLLASELFGHARGAFTGAVRDQPGRVEAAEGGTLFLDEIGEMAPGLQAKLLRFLQDHEFERVGETRTRVADVRVVAATNRDLEQDVREGRFREDLLYRLNVLEVTLPPLRERPEDILPLARHFLAFFARSARRTGLRFSPEAEAALGAHRWPGNVRELRNAVERAVVLAGTAELLGPELLALPPAAAAGRALPAAPPPGSFPTLDELEREHVRRALSECATLEEAAARLGIDPSTLWRKRKKLGL